MRRSVTLEDVAREAGLSRAQVSRALRGDTGVLPETRKLAEEAARRINYQPNLAARTLASTQTRTVGILIGEPLNPFHMMLAQALDTRLAAAGYDSVVSIRAAADRDVKSQRDWLLSMRACGAFLISTPSGIEAIEQFAGTLPSVYLGRQVAGTSLSSVSADDEAAAAAAIRHLIGLGHRHIAHITGGELSGAKERQRGYLAAMEAAGLTPFEVPGNHDIDSGQRGVQLLLQDGRPFTAIFSDNDLCALGTMNELQRHGLRVPTDISVMGFDDIPSAGSEAFSLSTMQQDPVLHAEAAIDALNELVGQTGVAGREIKIPTSLVVRRSTGAAKPG